MTLYIGPGISVATVILVVLVLLIVFASLGVVLWRPIKRFIDKIKMR